MTPAQDLERPIFRDVLLPLFRKMIQNACVNNGKPDSGFEDRNVAVLKEFFRGYGLDADVFHALEGRGNLLIRIPGTNPDAPSLMLMGHMDVVPAKAQDWAVDPFSAELVDGQIWGRGAVDMLCWTASQAVGFAEALKKAPGGRFAGDLIFLALADEEAGGQYGAQHMVEHHWDQVRCDYMVTELGGFFIDSEKGPTAFVNLGEKGVAWLKLTVRGTPGHGSMPYQADNAALKIAEAATKLARLKMRLSRHSGYRSMAKAMARGFLERFCLARGIATNFFLKRLYRRSAGMAKFLHTAGWTTVSPNMLRSGEKVNIIADRGELLVDIRFLPGLSREDLMALVQKTLGKKRASEFQMDFVDFFPSNVSPSQTPLKNATESIFLECHPDARLADLFIGGVTDGRFWRSRGTTVYGFSLFDKDLTMDAYSRRIHGIDERISLSSLSHCLHYFTELPQRFFDLVAVTKVP